MTIPLQQGIVYGPVQSRRLGGSLGVNVLPDQQKICNFNCPYCEYGWTPADPGGASLLDEAWPSPERIAEAVERALENPDVRSVVERITLAGNGEPTLHPCFPEVVDRLRRVRDRHAPGIRLSVLSNASTLSDPAIVTALLRLDERFMKLDAGDDATLRKMNASPVPVARIVDGLARMKGVVLQSMFTRDLEGRIDNTTVDAVERWLTAVARVRPTAVHLYTLDRDPAWARLQPVPRSELEAIGRRVETLNIQAVVF